jgi:hypothetical protein
MPAQIKAEVYGLRETMAQLRQLDKELYKAAMAEMKQAAEPLKMAIHQSFPSQAPLSGFDHNGRTGWSKRKKPAVKFGGRKYKSGKGWPLLRILVNDAPGQISDMADNGSLGANLSARYGGASRFVYKQEAKLTQETVAAIVAAGERAAAEMNRNLAQRPGRA